MAEGGRQTRHWAVPRTSITAVASPVTLPVRTSSLDVTPARGERPPHTGLVREALFHLSAIVNTQS